MLEDAGIGRGSSPAGLRWRWAWRLGAWLVLALVVILSVLPTGVPPGFDGGDKVQHLLAYMILGYGFQALYPRRRRLVLLGLMLLGVALEGAQMLLPTRVGDVADVIANVLGVLLGGWLAASLASGPLLWLEQRLRCYAGRVAHKRN